ncbi:hypothetical protein SeMB42_g07450 [Synchytrium endobioticum]|uniref:Uncharacterized protein n=1 Tax=Synchytrium endobioticum TaxID=286115 RepID=A0A507C666_9FUNG|nr:hypothetical protein SeMB42_g07450 [Synchytrium endobioticum]
MADASASSRSRKLDSDWSGPWTVVQKKHDTVYKIRNANRYERTVNVNTLGAFMSPITHRATSQDATTGSLPAPNPHAERRKVTEHLPQPPAEISVCPGEDLSVVRVDKHSNVTSRMSMKLQQLKARAQSKRTSTTANENVPLQVTGHLKVGRGYIYMVSWSNGDSYEVYKKDLRATLLKQYWKRCDTPDQEKPTEFRNSRPRTQPQ